MAGLTMTIREILDHKLDGPSSTFMDSDEIVLGEFWLRQLVDEIEWRTPTMTLPSGSPFYRSLPITVDHDDPMTIKGLAR
jgi:hypothetical protein